MRIDKVSRKMSFGFKKVYSLLLEDDGLYIIRTGNVGALQYYSTGGILTDLAAKGITHAYVKQLEEGEARLATTSLDELAAQKGNAFIPQGELQDVTMKSGKEPHMTLKTAQGDFSFIFTHTPIEQVEALRQALEQRT